LPPGFFLVMLCPPPGGFGASHPFGGDISMLASLGRATCALFPHRTEADMTESVYKVIELIGTSSESWEKAAAAAVERASKTLRELRVAEVVELDLQLDAKGKIEAYRAKLNVSFKFEGD
jgi:flavin-binding protein dodecin